MLPSLRDDPAVQAPDHALQRLLAGLRVDDDTLEALVLGLAAALGANPAAATEAGRGFALTVENLSLLHRHAQLARWLKLPAADLFRTIALAPGVGGDHVADPGRARGARRLRGLDAIARRGLDEVEFATGSPVLDPTAFPAAADVAQNIVARVAADASLPFMDTVFAFPAT